MNKAELNKIIEDSMKNCNEEDPKQVAQTTFNALKDYMLGDCNEEVSKERLQEIRTLSLEILQDLEKNQESDCKCN